MDSVPPSTPMTSFLGTLEIDVVILLVLVLALMQQKRWIMIPTRDIHDEAYGCGCFDMKISDE